MWKTTHPFSPDLERLTRLHDIGQIVGEGQPNHPKFGDAYEEVFQLAYALNVLPSDVLNEDAELYDQYLAWRRGYISGSAIRKARRR